MKRTVWFNGGLWVMAEALEAIRAQEATVADKDRVIERLIVTHTNPHFIGFEYADHALLEPTFETPQAYAQWALAFVREQGIDCIVASRNLEALELNAEVFEAMGVQVLTACDTSSWDVLDDKIAFFKCLEQNQAQAMLPKWTSWCSDLSTSLSSCIKHVTQVEVGERPRKACIKPSRGIFGQGFFVFVDSPDPEQQLLNVEAKHMEPARFLPLAFSLGEKKGHSEWQVVEFLPGSEYSVDCLAWEGKLVASVAREKRSPANHGQVIVDDPVIVEYCEQLARIFGMRGVFNAQFKKDADGCLRILEINPRFSGGMGMSLLSGVNLVWWWLKLASGANPGDVPACIPDQRVYSWRKAVLLPDYRV